jgi:hypothetical protein
LPHRPAPPCFLTNARAPCQSTHSRSRSRSPQYNPDAAPADEKLELLKAGPWCFKDEFGTKALECDGKAQRTQRAGIYEMQVCSAIALIAPIAPIATLHDPTLRRCYVLADLAPTRPPLLREPVLPGKDCTPIYAPPRNHSCWLAFTHTSAHTLRLITVVWCLRTLADPRRRGACLRRGLPHRHREAQRHSPPPVWYVCALPIRTPKPL